MFPSSVPTCVRIDLVVSGFTALLHSQASLERMRLASSPSSSPSTNTIDQEQEEIQSRLRESRGASTSYASEQPRSSSARRPPRSKKSSRWVPAWLVVLTTCGHAGDSLRGGA